MHPSLIRSRVHKPLIRFIGKRQWPSQSPKPHPSAPAELKAAFSDFIKKFQSSSATSSSSSPSSRPAPAPSPVTSSKSGAGEADVQTYHEFWQAPQRLWKRDIDEAEIEAVLTGGASMHWDQISFSDLVFCVFVSCESMTVVLWSIYSRNNLTKFKHRFSSCSDSSSIVVDTLISRSGRYSVWMERRPPWNCLPVGAQISPSNSAAKVIFSLQPDVYPSNEHAYTLELYVWTGAELAQPHLRKDDYKLAP